MTDPVKDAINDLIDAWNAKQRQRVTLPPGWSAWLDGLSTSIDNLTTAYEAQQAASKADSDNKRIA